MKPTHHLTDNIRKPRTRAVVRSSTDLKIKCRESESDHYDLETYRTSVYFYSCLSFHLSSFIQPVTKFYQMRYGAYDDYRQIRDGEFDSSRLPESVLQSDWADEYQWRLIETTQQGIGCGQVS